MLKNIAFSNTKHYFIYFNTPLYNIPNIKGFIFFTTSLKYYFFIVFLILSYSPSHLFHSSTATATAHAHCHQPPPRTPTATATTTHNLKPQPPKSQTKTNPKPNNKPSNHKLKPTPTATASSTHNLKPPTKKKPLNFIPTHHQPPQKPIKRIPTTSHHRPYPHAISHHKPMERISPTKKKY